ncbi:hypothetical protein EAV90_35530, partial [Bradyrhizobium vignae]
MSNPRPYRSQSRTLYVLHAFGPNHLRSYTVAEDGKLKLRPERASVNTATKTDRVATQAVLSPDGRFLLVDILFDARPAVNPDGSPKLVVANAPDPDGLVIFPVRDDGALGEASFANAGGAGPFYIAFLNRSRDTFLNGFAVGDGVLALLWQIVFSPLFFTDLPSAIWAMLRRRPKDEIDDGVTYGWH